jgi:hypothetical protein
VIPPPVHPTGQLHALTNIFPAQFAACMCLKHNTFLRKKIALRFLRGAIDRQNPGSTTRMPVFHRPARLIIIISIVAV